MYKSLPRNNTIRFRRETSCRQIHQKLKSKLKELNQNYNYNHVEIHSTLTDFAVKICKYIIKDSYHFTSLTSQMTIILILILYSIVRTSFKKQTIKRSYRCQCIQSTRGYFDLNQEKLIAFTILLPVHSKHRGYFYLNPPEKLITFTILLPVHSKHRGYFYLNPPEKLFFLYNLIADYYKDILYI